MCVGYDADGSAQRVDSALRPARDQSLNHRAHEIRDLLAQGRQRHGNQLLLQSQRRVTFICASLAASPFLVAIGAFFLPIDFWMKGYLTMGIVMLIQTCSHWPRPCVTIMRAADW